MRSNKIASILLIVLSCIFSMTGLAQKGKVLRINIGGEVFKEFKTGEFDSVEIQDSEVVKGEINGYDYVDLGLPSGLKWATCNVGAISPDDPGYYFQWGEN